MNAFDQEPEDLVAAEVAAVERVIRSGWWVLGREVQEFEQEWATRVGATRAVGVANGLEALEIALAALGIGAGDEVVTTSMTAFATVLAVLRAGATPVLADIDPSTAMLDPSSVERCMSPRTKAILLVHLYGQAGPVIELGALAERAGVELIEDCAQAHGAMVGERQVGTFGAAAAWSFYPTKNLGAVGDAGAITTGRPELADRMAVLRNYGQTVRYVHGELGLNSRLDELQAAILRVRLGRLDDWTSARRAVAHRYSESIDNPEVELLPLPDDPRRHVHHLFVVRCGRRDELREHLVSLGVECLSHYPIPVHLQSPTRDLRRDPEGLACTESHAERCLSLPCHPLLTSAQVESVAEAVNAFGR
jgi:dTDP-4-amino-4,6-dideoxygalactose transaminase